jgi:hypothetical protein
MSRRPGSPAGGPLGQLASGAPLLGRPPPGALAWPAAGAHPHPWGGRPEGG